MAPLIVIRRLSRKNTSLYLYRVLKERVVTILRNSLTSNKITLVNECFQNTSNLVQLFTLYSISLHAEPGSNVGLHRAYTTQLWA